MSRGFIYSILFGLVLFAVLTFLISSDDENGISSAIPDQDTLQALTDSSNHVEILERHGDSVNLSELGLDSLNTSEEVQAAPVEIESESEHEVGDLLTELSVEQNLSQDLANAFLVSSGFEQAVSTMEPTQTAAVDRALFYAEQMNQSSFIEQNQILVHEFGCNDYLCAAVLEYESRAVARDFLNELFFGAGAPPVAMVSQVVEEYGFEYLRILVHSNPSAFVDN